MKVIKITDDHYVVLSKITSFVIDRDYSIESKKVLGVHVYYDHGGYAYIDTFIAGESSVRTFIAQLKLFFEVQGGE